MELTTVAVSDANVDKFRGKHSPGSSTHDIIDEFLRLENTEYQNLGKEVSLWICPDVLLLLT